MDRWLHIIAVVTLISFSAYLSAYTIVAHSIASKHIIEFEGGLCWRTSPPGSLFPWPKEPGMLQALSNVNALDAFIYAYLIRSMVLIGLSLLAWTATGIYALKLIRHQ